MSPSLPIDLDRSSGQPLYRQIERWIRHAIDGGRLPPGTRLPGVRTLARDLGVSVVPVITAYEQLAADGYLVTQVGLGTMVAPDPPRPIARMTVPASPTPSGGRPRPGSSTSSLPVANAWVPPRPPRPSAIPPRTADADLTRRLARSWSRHLHRARLLTDAAPAPLARDDDLGLVWLRSMLAVRAGLSRADAPGPDQLIVTAGIQAAIAAVARTWLGPDRTVAVAGHYPSRPREALVATGARVVDLDLADDGRRLGPPRERVDLIVVAPAIADAGEPIGAPARRRLLEWATRVGAVVLEDDRERELRAHRLPTLASLDGEGRVIGVGGIPAEIAPGAALGYLVVPAALHGPVAAMVLAGGRRRAGWSRRRLHRCSSRVTSTATSGACAMPSRTPRRRARHERGRRLCPAGPDRAHRSVCGTVHSRPGGRAGAWHPLACGDAASDGDEGRSGGHPASCDWDP